MRKMWIKLNNSIKKDYKILILICSNLSTLLKNKVPIYNSFEIIKESIKNTEYVDAITIIQKEIQKGNTISDSFSKAKIFPKIMITMISIGESSGRLNESLDNIAVFYRSYENVIKKVSAAVFYPALLLIMLNIVFIYMMFNIVPEFQEMYKSLESNVTGIVQLLFNISDKFESLGKFFIIYYLSYVVLLPILIFKILRMLKVLKFQFKILKIYREYKFMSLMSIMLDSGILIEKALNTIYVNEENYEMKQVILEIISGILSGASLGVAIKKTRFFSKESEILIKIGEESGSLDEKFKILKDSNERKLYDYLSNFTNKLQPVLIALMAFIIGGFLILFMLPLYGAIG